MILHYPLGSLVHLNQNMDETKWNMKMKNDTDDKEEISKAFHFMKAASFKTNI